MPSRARLLDPFFASPRRAASLGELVEHVAEVRRAWDRRWRRLHAPAWFRGHGDFRAGLRPLRYRRPYASLTWAAERSMFLEFTTQAVGLLPQRPADLWEWLSVAQHHGLPTRLLDWSEGALLALFFALREQHESRDVALWMLNPQWLNQAAGFGASVIVPAVRERGEPREAIDDALDDYLRPLVSGEPPKRELPLAIRPFHVTRRLTAQRGTFVVFGKDEGIFERLGAGELAEHGDAAALQLIHVPRRSVAKMRDELIVAGVSESMVFPDLAGLAVDVAYRTRRSLRLDAIDARVRRRRSQA
jgi:hypothetical protein